MNDIIQYESKNLRGLNFSNCILIEEGLSFLQQVRSCFQAKKAAGFPKECPELSPLPYIAPAHAHCMVTCPSSLVCVCILCCILYSSPHVHRV